MLKVLIIAGTVVFAVSASGELPCGDTTSRFGTVTTTSSFPSDDEVRSLLRGFVEAGDAAGIVVGMVDGEGNRRVVSYGETGTSRQLDSRSAFELGSGAKTFTATVLADMVRRGEVSMDDPLSKFIPSDVAVPSYRGQRITLRHLATHSSGLPHRIPGFEPRDPSNPYAHTTSSDLYAFLGRFELARAPGVRVEYSNIGMALLGIALASAAGRESLEEVVHERILVPLRMHSTTYDRTNLENGVMVQGYNGEGEAAPYWDAGVFSGAGGLISTADDMLAYLSANLGRENLPIVQSMRATHHAQIFRDDGSPRTGLAWSIMRHGERTLLGHGGGTAGFRTGILLDPERQLGVVVLANSGSFNGIHQIALALMPRRPTPLP